MQQMYYCPNCRAPVAYGQSYCTSCNTVLIWPTSQTQDQYQSPPDQYPNQQQSWQQPPNGQQYGWNQQQQWHQASPDNQTEGWVSQGQNPPQNTDERPGLLQLIKDNRKTVTIIAIAVVAIVVLIAAGSAFGGEISKWFTAPVVASFDASSSTITIGQPANLQWNVTGATSISINPDVGTVPSSGTRVVSPETTTTYTLVASSLAGSTSKTKTITVTGTLPSVDSFSFNTDSIIAGQSATLSWSVAGATSVSINPEIGTVSSTGTKSVSPASTTTYTLTASNGAGNSTASATMKVTVSSAPIVTTFSASPTSIISGEVLTLTWDVTGATSININQGIGGVASRGSTKVTPTATTTYTLTADSSYSSVTRSVTVTVDTSNATNAARTAITTSPPAINTFSASPSAITLTDNITLTWAVSGARTISISPNVGTVTSSGSTLVIPTGTTTYTLSAVNSFGAQTATATVTVNKITDGTAPIIKSFTATPSTISAGGTSSLNWDIEGATLITIDQGIGTPASHYSQPVSPAVTTTYALTAINSSGTDNRTVTVTVP